MILVSAGHRPEARGACYQTFCEWNEAMLWASRIVQILNHEALLVPTGHLRQKVEFINARRPAVAIEIHFNSAVDRGGNHIGEGCETLYMPGSARGRALAEHVHAAYAPLFPPDRGIKEGWYRMDPANGPDYFLRATSCPALILEPDFIHRQSDIQGNRVAACEAIAHALRSYVAQRQT